MVCDGEADGRPGGEGVGLCGWVEGGGGSGVAAHVGGVYVLEGAVGIVGFADVLVGRPDYAVVYY